MGTLPVTLGPKAEASFVLTPSLLVPGSGKDPQVCVGCQKASQVPQCISALIEARVA